MGLGKPRLFILRSTFVGSSLRRDDVVARAYISILVLLVSGTFIRVQCRILSRVITLVIDGGLAVAALSPRCSIGQRNASRLQQLRLHLCDGLLHEIVACIVSLNQGHRGGHPISTHMIVGRVHQYHVPNPQALDATLISQLVANEDAVVGKGKILAGTCYLAGVTELGIEISSHILGLATRHFSRKSFCLRTLYKCIPIYFNIS